MTLPHIPPLSIPASVQNSLGSTDHSQASRLNVVQSPSAEEAILVHFMPPSLQALQDAEVSTPLYHQIIQMKNQFLSQKLERFLDQVPSLQPTLLHAFSNFAQPRKHLRIPPELPIHHLLDLIKEWTSLAESIAGDEGIRKPDTFTQRRQTVLQNGLNYFLEPPHFSRFSSMQQESIHTLLHEVKKTQLFPAEQTEAWQVKLEQLVLPRHLWAHLSSLTSDAAVVRCSNTLARMPEEEKKRPYHQHLVRFLKSLRCGEEEPTPYCRRRRQWIPALILLSSQKRENLAPRHSDLDALLKQSKEDAELCPSESALAAGLRAYAPEGGIIKIAWSLFELLCWMEQHSSQPSKRRLNLAEFVLKWAAAPANKSLLDQPEVRQSIENFINWVDTTNNIQRIDLRAHKGKAAAALKKPLLTPSAPKTLPIDKTRLPFHRIPLLAGVTKSTSLGSIEPVNTKKAKGKPTCRPPSPARKGSLSRVRQTTRSNSLPGPEAKMQLGDPVTYIPPAPTPNTSKSASLSRRVSISHLTPRRRRGSHSSPRKNSQSGPSTQSLDQLLYLTLGTLKPEDLGKALARAIKAFLLEGIKNITLDDLQSYKFENTPRQQFNRCSHYALRRESLVSFLKEQLRGPFPKEKSLIDQIFRVYRNKAELSDDAKNGALNVLSKQLKGELSKSRAAKKPLSDTIAVAKEWLLQDKFLEGAQLLEELMNQPEITKLYPVPKSSSISPRQKMSPRQRATELYDELVGNLENNWPTLRATLYLNPDIFPIFSIFLRDWTHKSEIKQTVTPSSSRDTFEQPNWQALRIFGEMANDICTRLAHARKEWNELEKPNDLPWVGTFKAYWKKEQDQAKLPSPDLQDLALRRTVSETSL